jgi:hypothetical protein
MAWTDAISVVGAVAALLGGIAQVIWAIRRDP